MMPETPRRAFGRYVYGAGVIAMAVVGFLWGDFVLGQPAPKWLPARTALAYAAATFMLVAGAAVEVRRTVPRAAAALAAYYVVVVVLLMNGRLVIVRYAAYGSYSGVAEQLTIGLGALLLYASSADLDAARAARLTRLTQRVFGVCAVLLGGAHFVYMNLTAPLVPTWLPPGQEFWGYATGAGFVAAGVALVTGVRARLAAILMTGMIGSFTVLVHVRMLLAESNRMNWTEGAVNLVIVGASWILADSLGSGAVGRSSERS